ncbi:pitrilysin family protein [Paucibacter sp. APW11]|uniref:Pitrilysin family protein n=1 Tax=Roseateles aquae TaxID=3077235 RepID=A0ABU3P7X0_9BURK|nr:pitrilysin family protein [Paucibacter sp. APW11]MDT8998660.1 pitrilysin family protein [Paucibacter sp. APW11]
MFVLHFSPKPLNQQLLAVLISTALAGGALAAAGAEPSKPVAGAAAKGAVKPAAKKAPAAPAAPVMIEAQFVRELGGISEYSLPNGLQILLFPDEAQSTSTVNITYRVGSRHESQGEYGMAHLLEHLVFKGTPSNKDIPTALAERGVRFNGTTTNDRTNYFASFNANPDTLAFMLGLEADRMRNSFIAKSDLDKEMSVVRNEFERGENDPMRVLSQRVQAVAFDWHAYGHSTIGPKSDIENVPIEKLQAFYRRYYRPDNATLLVAGRFDREATLKLIAERFGPIAKPAEAIPEPYTEEPAQDGERSVVVRRIGGQPTLLAHYHVPAIAHADSAPLLVLSLLMSMQPSGHLYKELVESKLALGAGLGGLGGQAPGSAQAIAVLAPGADVSAVENKLLALVEGRAGQPFTEEELARVREVALLSYRQQMKSPEGLIQQISSLLGAGDWRLLFQLMDDLPKVTLADVERVRKAYFKPANRTLGRYLPASEVERVQIPAAPPLAERLALLKPPPVVEQGERFEPTPQALESRTQRKTLPSGIELQTLAKQTRGNSVTLQLQLRWGEPRATTAALGTTMVGQLLAEGSTHWDKQKLRDEMVRLKANLNVSAGNQGATLYLSAERDTLIEALRIAAELMREPRLPADAFERLKRQGLAALEGSRQELHTMAAEANRAHINAAGGYHPGDPDYRPSLDERIDELRRTTLADVQRFHRQYWSADAARVAVVGTLPAGLDAAIEQLFGDWKKTDAPRFQRHIAAALKLPPARFDVQATDKANATLQMVQSFELSRQDADYLPMMLAVHVFGAGGMESRLSTRVRRQEGLSYGVGAGLSADYFGRSASLEISGSYAPQNREKILAVIREEVLAMSEQGPSEAELARAKHDVLEGWKQGRADDGRLGGALLWYAELGKTWPYEAEREAQLQAVTLEQLRAAWRRLIRPEAFVVTTAGDFAGAAGK